MADNYILYPQLLPAVSITPSNFLLFPEAAAVHGHVGGGREPLSQCSAQRACGGVNPSDGRLLVHNALLGCSAHCFLPTLRAWVRREGV